MKVEHSPLGQTTQYKDTYDASLLYPIPRQTARELLSIDVNQPLPFAGFDILNAYELSWLDSQGKPKVAIATIILPCESANLIESKSLKLYLNSLNNSTFDDITTIKNTIKSDLSKAIEDSAEVAIVDLNDWNIQSIINFAGTNLDLQQIACTVYHPDPTLLTTENNHVAETVYSNLLRSNCPVTNQPDWGSVCITYVGNQINHKKLLEYIVSFRNHQGFHESCIEHIFIDIMQQCQPSELTVEGRYTRRGGIDINPYRSTNTNFTFKNSRLARQ